MRNQEEFRGVKWSLEESREVKTYNKVERGACAIPASARDEFIENVICRTSLEGN